NEQGQVLVTLGISFIIAEICLLVWTGDPMPLPAPAALRPPLRVAGYAFPTYRLVVLAIALIAALALYLLMERTRLGAMIRAGVDDMEMARGVGIPVSRLFTTVFLLGAPLAVIGGEFYVNMASQVLIYALFALSINMMLGYGGMVSLGHAAYLGIAGYACILATLAGYNQLAAAILAIAASTAAAALFGVLSLRAPGLGFIMITLALGQIVWGIAYRANDLTGGDNGIRHPARPMPFGFDIHDASSFYYFTLVVFLIALSVIRRFSL